MIQIIENYTLPEVEIYAIEGENVKHVESLLTSDAVELICRGEATGLAIVEENEVRGAICVCFSGDENETLEICSLYIAPAYRRRALGSTLFLEVLERGMSMTDGLLNRIECWFSNSADGMTEFLKSMGFQFQQVENSAMWYFTLGEVAEREILHKEDSPATTAVPLSCLSDLQKCRLIQKLEENGVNYISENELDKAQKEISYVMMSRKDPLVFRACVIWTGDLETGLCLKQFFFDPTNFNAPLAVLRASFKTLEENFPPETVLFVPTLTSASAKLVQQIAGVEGPQEFLQHAVLPLHA